MKGNSSPFIIPRHGCDSSLPKGQGFLAWPVKITKKAALKTTSDQKPYP
jgi:hypothetical protein